MEDVKKEETTVERNHRNYDESQVLRDLALANVKSKIITAVDSIEIGASYNIDPLLLVGKKVIDISRTKSKVGIKRLGKIDFLLNFCKGYIGVVYSK